MRFTRNFLIIFLVALLWASSAFATITNTSLKSGPYTTDGVTTVFAIVFQYIADSDITANIVNTTTGTITNLTLNTDFTVQDGSTVSDGTFVGGQITIQANAGGSIANGSGQFPSGYQLTILRNLPLKQQKTYPLNGAFPSTSTEQALDRLTVFTQQIQNQLNGAIQIPSSDNGITVTLPAAAARASKYLFFDASGNVTTSTGTGGITSVLGTSPISVSTVSGVATASLGSAVPVTLGGTGLTTIASGGILLGNGTGTVTVLAPGSNGQCNVISGGVPTWGSCSGTSTLTLGTSAAATNPQRSGQAGTGMYSDTTNVVEAAAGGVEAMAWNTLSSGVDYFTITPGKSGTLPIIGIGGSTTNQGFNLAPKGSGAVQISGVNYPVSVTNNNVLGISGGAVVNESVSTLLDNAFGSTRGSILERGASLWALVTPGTAGYVYTSNGAGADPSYQALTSHADIQTFTASGTWTKPATATKTYVQCWGAGAGGGGDASGGGGGGGSYSDKWYSSASLGATETVTVGAGSAGCNGASACAVGGNTTFSSAGNLLTSYGGGGADNQAGGGGAGSFSVGGAASGAAGGTAGTGGGGVGGGSGVSGGDATFSQGGGGGGYNAHVSGNSYYGGGGGGASSGTPGKSVVGGNGGTCGNPGGAGVQPGGGGAGTCAGAGGGVNGGKGGDGECIVTTFP